MRLSLLLSLVSITYAMGHESLVEPHTQEQEEDLISITENKVRIVHMHVDLVNDNSIFIKV